MSLLEFKRLYKENKGHASGMMTQEYGEICIEFPMAKFRKQFLDCINQCMVQESWHELFQILGESDEFDFYGKNGIYGMKWTWHGNKHNPEDAWKRLMWLLYE